MGKKKNILVILELVAFILIIVALLVYRQFLFQNEIKINKNIYPVIGIDVSAHTGKINFTKIRKQKIDFVFIKATEGETFIDKKLEENYFNATLNKIPTGLYHFFRFNRKGVLQANNFLKNIEGKKNRIASSY